MAPPPPPPPPRQGPPATPPGSAKTTPSGIAYEIVGTGDPAAPRPSATDEVQFTYTEWEAQNGQQIDSDSPRVVLSSIDAGFREALLELRVGDRARFWFPASMHPNNIAVIRDITLGRIFVTPVTPPDVAKPPRRARRLGKGLRYVVLAKGKGKVRPKEHDKVTVHYSGWTTDGKMFDSSLTRGRPATFKPSGVIEGWTMALKKMRAGDRWRVWIPKALAYKGQAGRPMGMLVFEIEVIKVEVGPTPPKTPRDVRRPPRRAKKTASGVSFRFLGQRNPRGDKPTAGSTVKVHYSGWTTDGKMFDSSVTRGSPATFGLGRVIPGWRDGIVEMRVGETMRMWIPEELAYKGKSGAPQGMLVFDVELLEIVTP